MVSVLALSVVDRGFEPLLGQTRGQTKDYTLWYVLLLREAGSIKEKKQILVGSESE